MFLYVAFYLPFIVNIYQFMEKKHESKSKKKNEYF